MQPSLLPGKSFKVCSCLLLLYVLVVLPVLVVSFFAYIFIYLLLLAHRIHHSAHCTTYVSRTIFSCLVKGNFNSVVNSLFCGSVKMLCWIFHERLNSKNYNYSVYTRFSIHFINTFLMVWRGWYIFSSTWNGLITLETH